MCACFIVCHSEGVSVVGFIASQPRISPKFTCGQEMFEDWQREFASCQIVSVTFWPSSKWSFIYQECLESNLWCCPCCECLLSNLQCAGSDYQ